MEDRKAYNKNYQKNYREINKEYLAEYYRIRYQSNKSEIKLRHKEYQSEHPEIHRLSNKRYYERKKLEQPELYRLKAKKQREKIYKGLILLLGGRCIICTSTDKLHIDHIYGNGKTERESFANAVEMWRYYLNHPYQAMIRLQLLCRSHSLKKFSILRERWARHDNDFILSFD